MINSIRAHLAEFGIVAPVGRKGVTELLHIVADPNDKRVSEVARACLAALGTQLLALKEQILAFDRMILAWHRSNQTSKRLHYIPGIGPMLATALVASVADPSTFRAKPQSLLTAYAPNSRNTTMTTWSAPNTDLSLKVWASAICEWYWASQWVE